MDKSELIKIINTKINKLKYDEDIKILHHTLCEGTKLSKSDSNIHVGLVNIPCGGFGDVVNCKTFSDYLRKWYPNMKVSICTSSIDKFKSLGIKTGDLLKLKSIENNVDGSECQPFDNLKFVKRPPKFDIMIVVPMINEEFKYKSFKKLWPQATNFNCFAVSEYNGEYGPYAFPTGVGDGQLGLMLTSMKIKKHNFIKRPYALAYTAGHDRGQGVLTHTNTCIMSFIEMICKKYNRHKRFQLIIPPWFCSEDRENEISLLTSLGLKTRYNNNVKKYFNSSYLVLKDGRTIKLFEDGINNNKTFILRGDILPKPRPDFISLIKYSVEDVLLTGDQSVTDGIAYSSVNKRIWYQISPWKKDFIHEVSKEIPNKYLDNFRTSCGTLKAIRVTLDNRKLIQNHDFRKKGKRRMDAILKFHSLKDDKIIKDLMECIEHSRYKDTALNKFNKIVNKE